MELLDHFSPLMSRTLHFAGSPDGMAVPLDAVHAALCELADKERMAVSAGVDGLYPQETLQRCRLAVYAWADEILLNSTRQDAGGWAGMTLQARYFDTSAAGIRVFDDLWSLLDEAEHRQDSAESAILLPAVLPAGLCAADDHPDSEGVALADRFEKAIAETFSPMHDEALRVYATCLLYGFCGRYYPQPSVLRRLRLAARALLKKAPPVVVDDKPVRTGGVQASLLWLEPALYVVVPLLVTLAFGLYCADILSGMPLTGIPL